MNYSIFKLKRVDPLKYAIIDSPTIGVGAIIFGSVIAIIVTASFFYEVVLFVITLIAAFLPNFILKKTEELDIDFEKVGIDVSVNYDSQDCIEH